MAAGATKARPKPQASSNGRTHHTTRPAASLPPVGIARFQEATRLVERLVAEKTDVFLEGMNSFQERKRRASKRPLNHVEAAQVAAALAEGLDRDPLDFAVDVQGSELRASDPATPQELLLAAGLSTAPEFIDAALKFVALIEMPADRFKAHRKDGTLRDQIDADSDAIVDQDLPVDAIRARAGAAFAHFARAGGEDGDDATGKAVDLVRGLISQALAVAMTQAAPDLSGPLPLTVSPPATGGTST